MLLYEESIKTRRRVVDIFQEDLKELREQIDFIDRSIIDLLNKRKSLTDEVVKFKSEHQARVYEPSIEEMVLGWRRDYTKENTNISQDMVEDIFRLVMYDAYHLADITYQRVTKASHVRKVLILGSNSSYGKLLNDLFNKSGYDSFVIEELAQLNDLSFSDIDAVFITSPLVDSVEALLKKGGVSPNTLLVVFGNLEARSIDIVGNMHSGPTLGLQPMFSAASKTLTKEVIFICHGHFVTRYLWLLDQIKMWGLIPVQADPTDYERLMLVINSLNHLINLSDAIRLVDQKVDVNTLIKSVGPNYRLSLMSLGRHFSKDKPFNLDPLFARKTVRMFSQFTDGANRILDILEADDRHAMEAEYKRVCNWFGESADIFEHEANRLSRLQPFVQVDGTLKIDS